MINTAEVDRLMKSFCEINSKVNIRIGIVRPAETASPSVFAFQVATKRTDAALTINNLVHTVLTLPPFVLTSPRQVEIVFVVRW